MFRLHSLVYEFSGEECPIAPLYLSEISLMVDGPCENNQDKDVIKGVGDKGCCRAVFVETAQQVCLFPPAFRSLCVGIACWGEVKRITEMLVEEASGGPHPASHLKPRR